MFRRRSTTSAPSVSPTSVVDRVDAGQLAADGWLLPASLVAGDLGSPAWTLVGTVDSPLATPVDPSGLVVGEGWSLDWWIGADDRWHLPLREAAVRQDLVGDAPVVETKVRIPGGDAVQRAFGVRSPRGTGDEWVVVEIENQTPVPLGVALVIRPFMADGLGAVDAITIEPVEGGRGPDRAHLVRIDGRPAVVVPRRPAAVAAGSRIDGDVVEVVTAGEAGTELIGAACPDGLATLALVFPLAHTATLRAVLPVGDLDPAEPIAYPGVIPDAPTVASGWDVHRRGPRFEVPERRLQVAIERSRARLQLAHDGVGVRRDGRRAPELQLGATDVILGALDELDRPAEVGPVVARWIERLADASPADDALALAVVANHWLLHRVDELLEWLLPEVAAAVERIDRADRKGRLTDPPVRRAAIGSLRDATFALDAAGQADAAGAVAALVARLDASSPGGVDAPPEDADAADAFARARRLVRAGDPAALDVAGAALRAASTTTTWPGHVARPGSASRAIGDDLAAAAGLVRYARSLLVTDTPEGLDLLCVFPPTWYGGGVELHDAPTAWGRLSFAVRWHGTRPALLWELEPHDPSRPVRIRVPGLDPAWSSTEARAEALLAEVEPPADLELITSIVAEHPDIDPSMRRPGDDPGALPPTLPEGGTFS